MADDGALQRHHRPAFRQRCCHLCRQHQGAAASLLQQEQRGREGVVLICWSMRLLIGVLLISSSDFKQCEGQRASTAHKHTWLAEVDAYCSNCGPFWPAGSLFAAKWPASTAKRCTQEVCPAMVAELLQARLRMFKQLKWVARIFQYRCLPAETPAAACTLL